MLLRIPIVRCSLVRDGSVTYDAGEETSHTITEPAKAAAIFAEYLKDADREHLVVLLLNSKNKVIGINTVSIGILDQSLAHAREVFKPAILASAAAIILGHNHPSGDPQESSQDRHLTQKMHECGQLLGIDLLDHIIVGAEGKWVSLKQKGVF